MIPTAVQMSAGFTPPEVIGLDAPTQEIVTELLVQWRSKLPRNIERMIYLDGKNKLKDLKIALPPSLVDSLDIVMGWPEKAVYDLADRIVLERIRGAGDDADPFGLKAPLTANRFESEFPQATASSLAHSTAFVSATPGDVSAGEPEQLLMFHSAMWATGLWSKRARSFRAALLISATDKLGFPTEFTVFLPDETLVCQKGARWYVADRIPNRIGRVPIEQLPFRPNLDRPFGRSRIDRRVMSLTDRGVRAGARLEVHAEMFTTLKLILLGADEDTFKDPNGNPVPLWSFYMGRLNTLSKDEDGDNPQLEKIAAESPQPHIEVLRELASEFSGHTGVPLGSLGIASDNPESAQSKTVARDDVVATAEKQQTIYESSIRRTLENLVMIREGLTEPPTEMLDLHVKWRRPDRATRAALADAGAKQVNAKPELADTTVGLELIGLDPDQIDRYESQARRNAGPTVLDRLTTTRSPQVTENALDETPDPAPGGEPEDASDAHVVQTLKAKFEALGIAIRSGVVPEAAAQRLGLTGIEMTGAVPVSLRMPEQEATTLEER